MATYYIYLELLWLQQIMVIWNKYWRSCKARYNQFVYFVLTSCIGSKHLQGVLRALFSPIFWRQKISNPKHSYVIFWCQNIGKQSSRKMLMKLTSNRKSYRIEDAKVLSEVFL
jgi:hypothetical protein